MNERKISVVRKHEEEPNRAKENKTEIESIQGKVPFRRWEEESLIGDSAFSST